MIMLSKKHCPKTSLLVFVLFLLSLPISSLFYAFEPEPRSLEYWYHKYSNNRDKPIKPEPKKSQNFDDPDWIFSTPPGPGKWDAVKDPLASLSPGIVARASDFLDEFEPKAAHYAAQQKNAARLVVEERVEFLTKYFDAIAENYPSLKPFIDDWLGAEISRQYSTLKKIYNDAYAETLAELKYAIPRTEEDRQYVMDQYESLVEQDSRKFIEEYNDEHSTIADAVSQTWRALQKEAVRHGIHLTDPYLPAE